LLAIELGESIMPTNNVTKFDDDPLKNIQVTEWTKRSSTANLPFITGWNTAIPLYLATAKSRINPPTL